MAEWVDQVSDLIEQGVATVRDRTVVPARALARALVFGLLAGAFASTAALLLAIGAFRALNNYLPEDVWAAHLVLGGIFVLAGAFVWTRRPAV